MRRKQEVNSVKMSVEALTGEVEDGWDVRCITFKLQRGRSSSC